jgi:hypothetical protein
MPRFARSTKTENVETVAGAAMVRGLADGVGGLARLQLPSSLVADRAGHVYVADYVRLRKVDAQTREVVTLAGKSYGCTPGVGSAASFQFITAVTLDFAHHLYVTDGECCTLSVLDLDSNTVSVLSGVANQCGHADGRAADARLGSAMWGAGMVYDGADKLYFTDGTTVRTYSIADQTVATLAGSSVAGSADGVAGAAQFRSLVGLAFDGNSTLYAADANTIRAIDVPSGRVTTFAGVPSKYSQVALGPLPARLNMPFGITSTAGRSLVFTDFAEHSILTIRGPL